jgi:hypothetical protein
MTKKRTKKPQEAQTLHCPRCGAEGTLGQRDMVHCVAWINSIAADGTIEWGGESEVDWYAQRAAHNPPKLYCRACYAGNISLTEVLPMPADAALADEWHLQFYLPRTDRLMPKQLCRVRTEMRREIMEAVRACLDQRGLNMVHIACE